MATTTNKTKETPQEEKKISIGRQVVGGVFGFASGKAIQDLVKTFAKTSDMTLYQSIVLYVGVIGVGIAVSATVQRAVGDQFDEIVDMIEGMKSGVTPLNNVKGLVSNG